MSEKIMELKTVQTGAFKTLSEALKEILTDANVEFTEGAMKIITMDPTVVIRWISCLISDGLFPRLDPHQPFWLSTKLPNSLC